MSAIDPFKFYPTPANKMRITWDQNREVHVSGYTRTTDIGGSPYVYGNTSSQAVITSYRVAITYDGNVDIGDRNIRSENVPNYWTVDYVKRQAQKNTGIMGNGDIDCVDSIITCLCCSTIVCCYCGWLYAYTQGNKRKAILDREIDKLAVIEFEKHLGNLLQQADWAIHGRVQAVQKKEKEAAEQAATLQRVALAAQAAANSVAQLQLPGAGPQQNAQPGGGITLSQDQFQALLQAAQQPRASAPQLPGHPGQSVQAPLVFSQQLQPSAPGMGGMGTVQKATLEIAPPDSAAPGGSKSRI